MTDLQFEHRVREKALEIVDRLWPMYAHYPENDLLALATRMATRRVLRDEG